jgi:hypothetical protein
VEHCELGSGHLRKFVILCLVHWISVKVNAADFRLIENLVFWWFGRVNVETANGLIENFGHVTFSLGLVSFTSLDGSSEIVGGRRRRGSAVCVWKLHQ